MNTPLDTPSGKRLCRFISDAMIALGASPGLLKLLIDDPGEHERREHCKDFLLTHETPADRTALEVLHEAQEQADGTGPGSHRFRVQVFTDGAMKPFASTSLTLEAEGAIEDVRRQGSASTLLDQAYRHNEIAQKNNTAMFGATVQAMSSVIDMLTQKLSHFENKEIERARLTHDVVTAKAQLEVDVETKKAMLEMFTPIVKILGPRIVKKILKETEGVDDEDEDEEEAPAVKALPQTVTTPVLPATTAKNGHRKSPRK